MSANLLGASNNGSRMSGPFSTRAFKKITSFILVASVAFTSGCSGSNFLESFSTTDDDESLLRSALDSINDGQFADAIESCELMSDDMLESEKGAFVCASASAGACGYTLFTVVNQLSGFSGTPLLFEYFMEQNNGATAAKVTACGDALSLIRSVGTAANRSDDLNYLAMFSGLTNMGVILNLYADASTNDDGTPDVAFDSCDSATDLPDADAIQFGTALWEIYRSAEATPNDMTDTIKTALDAASTAIDAVDTTYNFLKAAANPSTFTANQIKGIRTLIKEGQAFGLDYPCSNFAACMCP